MAGLMRKPLMDRQNSYNAHHVNPLAAPPPQHGRSCSEGNPFSELTTRLENSIPTKEHLGNEENQDAAVATNVSHQDVQPQEKENLVPNIASSSDEKKLFPDRKSYLKDRVFKPTSLQFCMQNDATFGPTAWEPPDSKTPNSGNVWVFSDSEAAPASSWSTLPNRALLSRPLPVDIGRCKCIIVKENASERGFGFGFGYGSFYSLYTYEGQGRQNRKLAIAYHRRHHGRSEFIVAKNSKGLLSNSDDGFVGSVKANLMGSRYYILDKGTSTNTSKQSNLLQGILVFASTVGTWTGSYRSLKAWIAKYPKTLETKNPDQMQQQKGAVKGNLEKTHQLLSRVPQYNRISKQYELDFRERGHGGLRIQRSVKNFQLCMEGNKRQTVLQLGRVSKSEYLMDFRYPLTGYQAFCVCLASIDSKLCCTV